MWSHEWQTGRDDLAPALAECGSGIPHLLAMLYVVYSKKQKLIMVDDPESFLHASAIRRLVEVFRRSGHQFILTTHSPTVISAASVRSITLVKSSDGVSHVDQLDATQSETLRMCLAEVGVSLSEVFGADHILWVEGPTEEICFPTITEKLRGSIPFGTMIKAVVATGDLEVKDASRIFGIYDRLSAGPALLPPATGFLFDDEGRSEAKKNDMRKRGAGRVWFLSRRMYENYLVNPAALAQVINTVDSSRPDPVMPSDIQAWLAKEGRSTEFGVPPAENPERPWETYVNGAKVLRRLFSCFSDQRIRFEKPIHSVQLTRWILEHEPETFREIADLISDIVK